MEVILFEVVLERVWRFCDLGSVMKGFVWFFRRF